MCNDSTLAESAAAQRGVLRIHEQITWDNRAVVPNMLPSASSGNADADMMVQCVKGLARLAVTLACYPKEVLTAYIPGRCGIKQGRIGLASLRCQIQI